MFGAVTGAALYMTAFIHHAPSELCRGRIVPTGILASSDFVTYFSNATRAWLPIVAARCQVTFATGGRTSAVIVDWSATATAVLGLAVLTASAWLLWRTRPIPRVTTDAGRPGLDDQ